LLTPLVNQTRHYLEPAGDCGDRGTGSKCRRQNLLTFLVTSDDNVSVPSAT